jgi:hypothetical protein
MDDNRTMKDLAEDVFTSQNACNLSGVVHSFSRDITRLRALLEESMGDKFNTTALNRHPISVMWASKIASLTLCEGHGVFSKAYSWCVAVMSGGTIPEWEV